MEQYGCIVEGLIVQGWNDMTLQFYKITFALIFGGAIGYFTAPADDPQFASPIFSKKSVSDYVPEYTIDSLSVNQVNSIPSLAELVKIPSVFERNLNAHLLVVAVSEKNLKQLIRDVIVEKDNIASLEISQVFLNRYVELNPYNAVLFLIDNLPSTHHHFDILLKNVFYEWFRFDSGAALASLQELESTVIREMIVEYLAIRGEFVNIPELNQMISGLSDASRYNIALQSVQNKDPAQAFEELLTLPNKGQSRDVTMYVAIQRWARIAPEEALSRVLRIEKSMQQDGLVAGVVHAWASIDPEAALLAMFAAGNEIKNGSTMVLSEAGRSNGLEAVELVEKYSDRLGDRAMNNVLTGWAMSDPRAAAAYVEVSGLATNDDIIRFALHSYGREYPREAYEWGVRIGVTAKGMKGIVGAVAGNNPLEAEQIMLELPSGIDRDQFLVSIASGKANSSPESAVTWLEQYRGERSYGRAVSSVVKRWGYREPARAAEELLKIGDDKLHKEVAPYLVKRWYTKDPLAVVDWVYLSTEGELRDHALGALALASASDDKDQSQEFVKSIIDPKTRTLIETKIKGGKSR